MSRAHGFTAKFIPNAVISPDGTKLIYFATNYSAHSRGEPFPSAWTAISKVPWLTALALWPNGSTYFGGGLFETNSKIWVNPDWRGWSEGGVSKGYIAPRGLEVSYEHRFWDHDWHTLFRLEWEGWVPVEKYPTGSVPLYRLQPDGSIVVETADPNCPLLPYLRAVHEKPNPQSSFSLVRTLTRFYLGGQEGEDDLTFELKSQKQQSLISLEGAGWADWDKNGRLVYAKEGRLFSATIEHSGEIRSDELAEFNSSRPRRTKSPQWAREW